MKFKNFEEWLQYKHAEWYPEILDDDLPDAYNDWLSDLSEDDWFSYGDMYAKECMRQCGFGKCKIHGVWETSGKDKKCPTCEYDKSL